MSWREDYRQFIDGARANNLHAESPQADQPASIKPALRPHQLTLLAAARALESHANMTSLSLTEPQLLTRFGTLADRVGAGKSLVALSLVRDPPVAQVSFSCREGGAARIMGLKRLPPVADIPAAWMDLAGSDLQAATAGKRLHVRTALIIVPHNVVSQWETYVHDQTDLKAVVIKRTKDCDYDAPQFLQRVLTAELVLVSGTMLKKFMGAISMYGPLFRDVVWSRLFIDEADTIPCALRLNDVAARFTWFITGSWLNMLFPRGLYEYVVKQFDEELRAAIGNGHIAGLSSHMNIVSATVSDSRDPRFTALIIRNSDAWIDASLARPMVYHDTVMCRAPANLGILRDFVTPAALEALHAGDTAAALAAMGIKASSKESMAAAVTASLRGELVQAEKLLAFKRDMEYSTPAVKKEALVKAEAKVARLQEQLTSLENRIAGAANGDLCPICYDTPRTTTLTPCCRQAFCLSCICECLATKPACPLCRLPIQSPKQLVVLGAGGEEAAPEAEEDLLPTKGAALLNLLGAAKADERYLVFSAHEASFKGLRELLATRDIRCEVLQGTAARIDRLRRQFRDGTVRVLCMNARHVGAGLNLESATHVVLYHRMNVELERQVIGRAVRFERTGELRVVHLVHEQETTFNGAHHSEVIMHV
jgi:hypothetical protein